MTVAFGRAQVLQHVSGDVFELRERRGTERGFRMDGLSTAVSGSFGAGECGCVIVDSAALLFRLRNRSATGGAQALHRRFRVHSFRE